MDWSSLTQPVLAAGSSSALVVFLFYTLAVFGLAALSNQLLKGKSFLSEYFLGSRSLGVWAFALTFAATSASGGSFTGFPARIYTHGWILGLWIASYLVVPICTMGLIGKRLNQVARISGSITVPDVMRDRYGSPLLGLLAVSLIVFFMSFNLVGQFKAGSKILTTLLQDVQFFQDAVGVTASWKQSVDFLQGVDAAYLLCLVTFAIAVIFYTTYGGFHAVVWTDVMQGVVMVIGVMLMLPLAISQVGGLENATQEMAQMTPPRVGLVDVPIRYPVTQETSLSDVWFTAESEGGDLPRLFRINGTVAVPAGKDEIKSLVVANRKVVEITTPSEIERQLEKLNQPAAVERLNTQVTLLKQRQLEYLQANNAASQQIDELQAEIEQVAQNQTALVEFGRSEPARNRNPTDEGLRLRQ